MAKIDDYNKFKAIQKNNEEIAQQDFAGMRRTVGGWSLVSPTALAITGSKPVLKSGGKGAAILDVAFSEPKPTTAGQSILKAAGQWKQLNEHYKASGANPTAEVVSVGKGSVPVYGSGAAVTESAPQEQTKMSNPSMATTPTAAKTGAQAKTYTVNGSQMTLGEYIKSLGADPNAEYRHTAEGANAAYDRQRATYGAEAEALASQGLLNSGTSDYLDAQAYAEKQKQISQAAAVRGASNTALAAQYGNYLQQEKAIRDSKIQNALDRAMAMQLNTDNTVKYLMATAGLTKSEAQQYAEGTVTMQETTVEDEKLARKAKLQEISNAYSKLVSTDTKNGGGGMSHDAAIAYLTGETIGYDPELVDIATRELIAAGEQTKADQEKQTQKAVGEVFENSLGDWDGATAQAELAKLGFNVAVDEKDGAVSFRDMREAITNAYNSKLISEEQYLKLQKTAADNAMSVAKEVGTVGDMMQVAHDMKHDPNVYDGIIEDLASELKVNIREDRVGSMATGQAILTATLNGQKIKTTLTLGEKGKVPEAVKKVKAKAGDITTHNGKLYMCVQNNDKSKTFWVEAKLKGGMGAIKKEEQQKVFMEAVAKYYQKKQ